MIKLKTGETMSQSASLHPSLQSVFWSNENPFVKKLVLVLFGVLLMVGASQLMIPLKPVPITFQSAMVVLIGMTYGPRLGSYVVATYLIGGMIGLPFFANFSSQAAGLFGPTSGYLIGFLPGAFISGYLAQLGMARTAIRSFIAACIGTSVIFLFGITMLSRFVGWHGALLFGLVPFMFTETTKLIFISFIIPKLWKDA